MNLFYIRNLLIGSLNNSKYKPGDVIAECPSNDYPNVGYDYELELEQNGLYEIEAVSGGASGTHWDQLNANHVYYAGATGGYFIGNIYIEKGNYTFNTGKGGSECFINNGYYSGSATYLRKENNEIFNLSGATSSGGTLTVPSLEDPTTVYPDYKKGKNQTIVGQGHDLGDYSHGSWVQYGNQEAPVPSNLTSFGYGGGSGNAWLIPGYSWTIKGYAGGNGYFKLTYLGKG